MTDDDTSEIGTTLPSNPPFTFGIGLEGELIIGFVGGYAPPDGKPIRCHVVIPAEELGTLQRGLNESQPIRDALAAKKSDQGAH